MQVKFASAWVIFPHMRSCVYFCYTAHSDRGYFCYTIIFSPFARAGKKIEIPTALFVGTRFAFEIDIFQTN